MSDKEKSFDEMGQQEIANWMNQWAEALEAKLDPIRYLSGDLYEKSAEILKAELTEKWDLPDDIEIPKPRPKSIYPPKDSRLYQFIEGKKPEKLPQKASHAIEVILRSQLAIDCAQGDQAAIDVIFNMLFVMGHLNELNIELAFPT